MSSPPPSLPAIETLPSLPFETQSSVLATLFEPSAALAALAQPLLSASPPSPAPQYASYDALIAVIGEALRSLAASPSDEPQGSVLDGILCAHPRLGEKKVESAMSRMEQAAMGGGGQGSAEEEAKKEEEEEARMLRELNARYEQVFPGLIYTVFVNGRARSVIMEDMRRRIERGDRQAERLDAIEAMCAIASDRARKLQ